ncbi:MAG: 2-oxo acid dehydrogenase subunit E2 [Candidatus Binatia bacterium]
MATREIHVPDLGEFRDVPVVDILVKAGDAIEVESGLVTLETDKATMDVPSPVAGVLVTLHVAKGDRVSTGTLLATVETADTAEAGKAATAPEAGTGPAEADASPTQAAPAAPPVAAPVAPPVAAPVAPSETRPAAPSPSAPTTGGTPVDEAAFARAHASPSVRAFARELGVDLGRVTASGRKGRITLDDVKASVKAVMTSGATGGTPALPMVPAVDFAKFGKVEVVPLRRIQRIAGPRLHASWVNLPHVTQMDEADITELEEARGWLKLKASADGISLTTMAFVLRACVLALREFPRFNASLEPGGQNLVMKKYCHLGFAVDTPGGLVVPVIHDADTKDVFELARCLADLSAKARDGKLSAAEMQGGCFTVSNLGGIGGTAFTPIINAPEVAVLGVSRSVMRPVWKEEAFVPRLMLPLSLSYDHRVIDGADGARFTGFLAKALADVEALMAKEARDA